MLRDEDFADDDRMLQASPSTPRSPGKIGFWSRVTGWSPTNDGGAAPLRFSGGSPTLRGARPRSASASMLTIGSPGGKAETPPPEMEQKRQRGSKLKSPNPQRWFNSLIDILLTPGGDVYSNGRASARVTAQFRRQRVDQATNVKHQKRLRAERLVADAARLAAGEDPEGWLRDGLDIIGGFGLAVAERTPMKKKAKPYTWQTGSSPARSAKMEQRRQELLEVDISSDDELQQEWQQLTACRSNLVVHDDPDGNTDNEDDDDHYDPLMLGSGWRTDPSTERGGIFGQMLTKGKTGPRSRQGGDGSPTKAKANAKANANGAGPADDLQTSADLGYVWVVPTDDAARRDINTPVQDGHSHGHAAASSGGPTGRPRTRSVPTDWLSPEPMSEPPATRGISETPPETDPVAAWAAAGAGVRTAHAILDAPTGALVTARQCGETSGSSDDELGLELGESEEELEADGDDGWEPSPAMAARFAAMAFWIPDNPDEADEPPSLREDKPFVWAKADAWIHDTMKTIDNIRVTVSCETDVGSPQLLLERAVSPDRTVHDAVPTVAADEFAWQFNPGREEKIEKRRSELLGLEMDGRPELISEWLALLAFRSFLSDMASMEDT